LVDGERVASVNLSDRDQQHDSRESVSLSLEKWLPDKSNLKVMYMIELQQLKRDQWRVDTLNESTRQVFQDKGWNQNNMNLTGNVGYSKMVSPLFRLGLSYRFKYMENNARGEGWDLLKGLLDTNNTRDYTFYDYSHVGSVELKYLSKKTSVTLTVDMNYVARNHVERFPCRQQDKNNFLFLASNGHLSTTFSPVENLKVDYEVKTVLPSVEDTRRMVDDQYPLFLRAGNPNLKNTRHYTLGVQYNKTFVKRTLALEWLLNYKLIQNNIAPNSRYFMETTYLPEYDYTAVAGATLLTMENTDPWHSFGVSLKGSKRSGWLKSKLTCALSYLYEKQPSFTQGVQNDLIRNEGQFEYEVLTHFSRKVEFTLCSTTKLFREKSALDKASELLDETVRFLMRTTVIPKFRVSANLTYRYKKNFATSFETDQTALDVSVSRNIGKHTTLSLDGFNLLNMRSGVNIKKTAEYFSRSATSQTGRYVMLTLKYNFK